MSKKVSVKQVVPFLKQTYSSWSDHEAPRLGASVAFYSVLSFAPLVVLITAIIGLVFGNASAHGALVGEARQVIGQHGAETVDSLLKNAHKPASGTIASIIAFITLLFGASGVFIELQQALNIMWDAPKKQASGFMAMVKQRLFSFGMVLSVGFLLLISLLLSSGLASAGKWFGNVLPLPAAVLQVFNFIVSFVVIAGLFALMFKYVPDVHVAWRDVVVGAIGTAILFTIGKFGLGIYLGKASVTSPYGAAGSLVAVVVWIYYSAQIFFFGAEFTRVYAEAQRGHAAPEAAKTSGEHSTATAQPQALTAETPKAMAVAAGVPARIAVSSPATVPVAARTEVPVNPPPARIAASEGQVIPAAAAPPPAVSIPLRTAPRNITKPRLLAAAAIGFLVGRLASRARSTTLSR